MERAKKVIQERKSGAPSGGKLGGGTMNIASLHSGEMEKK